MNIEIKELKKENVDICTEIICDSVLGKEYGYVKENTKSMLLNASKKEEKFFTAHIDKNVVGLIWFDPKGAFTIAPYLKLIVVDEKYKGMNIGSFLLDFYEKKCSKLNKHYFLLVSEFNLPAIKFYEKRGYKKSGIIPSFVKQDMNEIIMIKDFS